MLIARNLVKYFGNKLAVNNVSLEVREGELYGLLGPNGAGKTTTIKLLTGLLLPNSGEVRINGYSLRDNPMDAKRLIGYVPDIPYFYEKLTGEELLKFLATIRNLDKNSANKRIDYLLHLFSLDEVKFELIEEYSLGMRHKLAFAAALLHDPPIIIIDEPASGLDPKATSLIKEILKEETIKRKKTILISTHILSLAEDICTTVGIIHKSELIVEGSIEEIKGKVNKSNPKLEDAFLELTT